MVALVFLLSLLFVGGLSETLTLYTVYSDSERYNSSSAVTAVTNAVNEFRHLLSNFTIDITFVNTQCDASRTLQRSLEYVTNPRINFVAIIGGGCSSTTDVLVDIAEYKNIPMVSYTPGPVRDSMSYFQLYPSDNSIILSLEAFIREYGWTQITIITEMDRKFLEVEYHLKQRLSLMNVTILNTFHLWSDRNITNHVKFESSARIFFLNTFEDIARSVLCHAFNSGVYYPNYAWLLYGWYGNNWFLPNDNSLCTRENMLRVIDHAVVIQQHEMDKSTQTLSYPSLFAYDAVVTLLQALNKTQEMIDNNEPVNDCNVPSSIQNSSSINCLLHYNILNMSFRGKSGDVSFMSDGVRKISTTYFYQYRRGVAELVEFAEYNLSQGQLTFLDNQTNSTVWPDGIPPDGSPITVISRFSLILVVIMYTWSFFGVLFSFVCLIFNIIFRKRKIIRLTSPNLNYFIIGGAILLFIIPYITLQQSFSEPVSLFSCVANIWAISLGIVSCFAPILTKMFRIYRIFRNPRANKKVLTDWHLFLIVLSIEGIVLFILFLGTALPYTRPVISYSSDRESLSTTNDIGITVQYEGINCYTVGSFVWIIIIAMFIGVLETIAIILAIKTRHVKVEAVNDSKEVVALVYIVTACSIAIILIAYVLQDYSNISEGLYLTATLVGTTSTITLMFIPKMWSLWKDPKGENVFEPKSTGSQLQSQLHRQDSERIETLQKEVGTLKRKLRENSFRLTSVQEVNEIDNDGLSNNGNNHQLPEVFSPPPTPGAIEKL